MSRECKIYYGTVVSEEGKGWARLGSHVQEPIKAENRDPLGKLPEFCCNKFGEAWDNYLLIFYPEPPGIRLRDPLYRDPGVYFCPFCGAKIILLEDLKLLVVKTTHNIVSYCFEQAV